MSKNTKKPYPWFLALKHEMKDPDKIIESDDRIVIIKDSYPKANYHFLVLPKEDIKNLNEVTKDHLDLLKHMDKKGREFAERIAPGRKFKFGYHAAPSMYQLHLHIISKDFDSPSMKHKKHWNSFTTKFFLNSENIIEQLEKNGKLNLMSILQAKELLKSSLKCHICKEAFSLFPKLKEHVHFHAMSDS
ncbi:aprataxin [Centruroides vittatus]|uniref:aprataxin n=1 Tax=Centruroides vittatus TaxID=120091 RepID=UPI00350E9B1F